MYIEWSYQKGAIVKGCLQKDFSLLPPKSWCQWMAVLLGKHTPSHQFLISALWWQPMPTSRSQEIISILFVQNPHLWKQATKNLAICWFNSQRVMFKKPFFWSYIYPTKPCSRRIHIRIADQPISCGKATRDSSSLCSSVSSAAWKA